MCDFPVSWVVGPQRIKNTKSKSNQQHHCFDFYLSSIFLRSLCALESILVDHMYLEIYICFFSNLLEYKYALMTLWISLVSVVMSPFASLILLFWIYSFLATLAKDLLMFTICYRDSELHWFYALFFLFTFH